VSNVVYGRCESPGAYQVSGGGDRWVEKVQRYAHFIVIDVFIRQSGFPSCVGMVHQLVAFSGRINR
jgi:hypothetical protein